MGLLELPNNLKELLAAKIVPGLSCFFEELLFGHSLSGDTRVVSAGDEKSLVSTHALVADESILDGNSKCMSDMKVPSDIGRWQANGEAFGIGGLVVGVEKLAEC